jgi:hypothetical protein
MHNSYGDAVKGMNHGGDGQLWRPLSGNEAAKRDVVVELKVDLVMRVSER